MPEREWLILRLEAPLLAFGGVVIDQMGFTRQFPAQSMLAGLLANALGWERTQEQDIQALQDRLVFAARFDREDAAMPMTDVQNARLGANLHGGQTHEGWTTRGAPEEGGRSSSGPHRRWRDYFMDARVMVALRLNSAEAQPDLAALAAALDRPARPLFIGRKPCLPSAPLLWRERVSAPDAYAALAAIAGDDAAPPRRMRALWPVGEGPQEGEDVARIVDLPDIRNWRTGLHGGTRRIVEGYVTARELAA